MSGIDPLVARAWGGGRTLGGAGGHSGAHSSSLLAQVCFIILSAGAARLLAPQPSLFCVTSPALSSFRPKRLQRFLSSWLDPDRFSI